MGSRKNDTEGIDEALLLASITQRKRDGSIQPTNEVQPPVQSLNEETVSTDKVQEPQKEATRKKKQSAGYDSVFLQRNEIKTRQCVYISREVHTKISKIVNVIADKEVTVGGYIDTVLAQHLELHKDEINELYKKQREDLI
jgi:hypothetical protein